MNAAAAAALLADHARLGDAVCDKIREAAARLGVDLGDRPRWSQARLGETTDPYSGETSLTGTWQDGSRYGSVTLFPDGRVYAEYQLLVPHPSLPGQFVEAVSVWGDASRLKSEPVLLAQPQ
jgi:hypothetical protein